MTATRTERAATPLLLPEHPPGRRSRKARAFADQIRELQARGYTLDAIRQALADAGIHVSRSTVHREATRRIEAPAPSSRSRGAELPSVPTPPQDASPLPTPFTPDPDSQPSQAKPVKGKDIAAAFFEGRVFNELVLASQRAKEHL